jgi:hypothetical protein
MDGGAGGHIIIYDLAQEFKKKLEAVSLSLRQNQWWFEVIPASGTVVKKWSILRPRIQTAKWIVCLSRKSQLIIH